MPADTAGERPRGCRGFCVHPTDRLGAPGGSHAGMAETGSAFKKPRILAVVGRFDRAQPTSAASPWEGRHDKSLQRRVELPLMAATNKCLAQISKTGAGIRAT